MQVLLIEDDQFVADSLQRGLPRYGYEVVWAPTGEEALVSEPTGVVLLDLGLPDIDGLDVCRALRARSDVPLIVVSGRACATEKIVARELGADDYVVKPFLIRELVARMRAVQRRHRGGRTWRTTYDRVTVDRQAHRVFMDGAEVSLSPKEYALLEYLSRQPDTLLTRDSIMAVVWDSNWFGSTKTLDTHVTSLRQKLGGALCIEAVRGSASGW
ncbi:response regulator transcription factor [Streptomyces sp. NY05-11A]|uniref:response regulator transcription factor n=1 Tax=Streptomyces soliscabiei TaxID=588897 RepID=UPI0029C0026D|nr:response regulator transcription factor [Streptomyces sp. NY05-11A]